MSRKGRRGGWKEEEKIKRGKMKDTSMEGNLIINSRLEKDEH